MKLKFVLLPPKHAGKSHHSRLSLPFDAPNVRLTWVQNTEDQREATLVPRLQAGTRDRDSAVDADLVLLAVLRYVQRLHGKLPTEIAADR